LEGYPANSPDFNMIEMLWAHLKQEIGKQCPLTMAELKSTATSVWESMPQKVIDGFVDHWSKVLLEETKRK
jgi:hypothetical protein